MFTTDKAISEMTQQELDQEYQYCIESANTAVDKEMKRYFEDRAAVIKRHMK